MSEADGLLITPAALAPHLEEAGWVVFDCRHSLADAEHGARSYAQGHIPGARFAHLDRDLCSPLKPGSGRHPLPAWGAFTRWLGRQGVDNASRVIVYDDAGGAIASRLWWMLVTLGHARTALLDGGFARWRAEGHPLSTAVPAPAPARFDGKPDPARVLTLDELLRLQRAGAVRLLDARSGPRYRGESEPIDPKAGHIPGAFNLPYEGNLGPEGTFLPPERLRERLLKALGGTQPGDAVHYCGSGVTACHNLLAQALAGLPPGRLYAGSWSQWCADPGRPVETGAGAGSA